MHMFIVFHSSVASFHLTKTCHVYLTHCTSVLRAPGSPSLDVAGRPTTKSWERPPVFGGSGAWGIQILYITNASNGGYITNGLMVV